MDENNRSAVSEGTRPDNQGLTLGNIGEITGRDLGSDVDDGPMLDEECDVEATPAGIPQNRMHNISIHSLDFGFNVKIGCQNFAVETVDKLIKNLEAFLNDPSGTERKWMNERKLL